MLSLCERRCNVPYVCDGGSEVRSNVKGTVRRRDVDDRRELVPAGRR